MSTDCSSSAFRNRLGFLIGEEKPFVWAKKAGIPSATFSRIWSEGTTPKSETLCLISEFTGASLDWILLGKGPMRPGEQETTTPSQGRGIEGYPEIGAVDVLDGIEIIEKIILKRGGKLYSPEQKVEMVRLACEIFADEDRKTSGHGNVVALNRIERAIRMAG